MYTYINEGNTNTDTQEVIYKFHAYAVFHDKYDDGEEWEWYHNVEICFNSEEEARDVISNAKKGTYKISKVIQTLHEYMESEDLETVVVE